MNIRIHHLILICLIVLSHSLISAEESNKNRIARYVENGIDQLETTINESRDALKGKLSSDSQKFHRERIAKLEAQRKNHTYTVSLPRSRPLKVGDIGQLVSNRMVVFQIIDELNLLAEVEWNEWKLRRVGNSVDRELVSHDEMVWISGLDTSQMVDKRLFKTEQVFEVIGNKTYKTSTGTKTVMNLELCDGIEEQAKKYGATNYPTQSTVNNTPTKSKLPDGFRTWVSADGKFKMVGKYISSDSSEVVLEKEDGAQIKVPIAALSDIDRNFLSKAVDKPDK